MTEKPGDKASSEAVDEMSASLMGVQAGKARDSNDWQAEVTPYANCLLAQRDFHGEAVEGDFARPAEFLFRLLEQRPRVDVVP